MNILDLYCGLGGWAKGFLERGHSVTGYDIIDFSERYPGKFIDNMQIYKGFLEDLNSGKFYQRFEAIQKIQEDQQQILKKTQELALQHTQRTDESISQVIDLVQKVSLQFYSSLNELKTAIVSMGRP